LPLLRTIELLKQPDAHSDKRGMQEAACVNASGKSIPPPQQKGDSFPHVGPGFASRLSPPLLRPPQTSCPDPPSGEPETFVSFLKRRSSLLAGSYDRVAVPGQWRQDKEDMATRFTGTTLFHKAASAWPPRVPCSKDRESIELELESPCPPTSPDGRARLHRVLPPFPPLQLPAAAESHLPS